MCIVSMSVSSFFGACSTVGFCIIVTAYSVRAYVFFFSFSLTWIFFEVPGPPPTSNI